MSKRISLIDKRETELETAGHRLLLRNSFRVWCDYVVLRGAILAKQTADAFRLTLSYVYSTKASLATIYLDTIQTDDLIG